jgi:hypothetical protein
VVEMLDKVKLWFIKTLCGRVVGWLLHHANQCPPLLYREEFYRLKDQLCNRFGSWERAELQHILKDCWDCDSGFVVVKGCRKCLMYGKRPGVWDEFWVRLERWNVGGYAFHKPTLRYYRKPEWCGIEIEGLIRHKASPIRLHFECFLWLTLFFDRKMFRRYLRSNGQFGWLPLLLLHRGYKCVQRDYWREQYLRLTRRYRLWRQRHAMVLPKFELETEDDIPF